ncbi:MAG: hypothetical protein WCX74_04260 [Candidatus Paceibacterota bacterium]
MKEEKVVKKMFCPPSFPKKEEKKIGRDPRWGQKEYIIDTNL